MTPYSVLLNEMFLPISLYSILLALFLFLILYSSYWRESYVVLPYCSIFRHTDVSPMLFFPTALCSVLRTCFSISHYILSYCLKAYVVSRCHFIFRLTDLSLLLFLLVTLYSVLLTWDLSCCFLLYYISLSELLKNKTWEAIKLKLFRLWKFNCIVFRPKLKNSKIRRDWFQWKYINRK
jgi:hypothetical protein